MNYQPGAANCDLAEAQMALDQYVNYMDKCEHLFGTCSDIHPNWCDTYNGFFIRNCVDAEYLDNNDQVKGNTSLGTSHFAILNQDLNQNDEWNNNNDNFGTTLPRGHPGWLDTHTRNNPTILNCVYDEDPTPVGGKENMSEDDAIGILLGLALVYKYMPSLSGYAADIANNIILHVSGGNSWVILDPNGNSVSDGAYAIDYAFGFALAGQFFGWPPEFYLFPGFLYSDFAAARNVWDGIGLDGGVPIQNCTMECTLAAIGSSWGIYAWPWSTIPFINTTMSGISNKCSTSYSDFNETFYCLLYNRLHTEFTVSDAILRIAFDQLSLAPDEGPYYYDYPHHASGGWASSYRWHNDTTTISGNLTGQTKGNFSGMDYMLLYNMYVLASGYPDITGYYPRSNVKLSANLPILKNRIIIGDVNNPECFVANNYIESDAKIRNSVRYSENQTELPLEEQIESPGSISYCAESITCKPGFTVEKPALFHAKPVPRILWNEYFKYNTTFFSLYGLVNPTYFGCWFDYPFVNNGTPRLKVDQNNNGFFNDTTKRKSIKDKSDNSLIKIFPNPATSFITLIIDGQSSPDCELVIADFYGQSLIRQQLTSSVSVINIQNLSSGLYLIHLRIFDQEIVKKLIKL
jgi:hypothetical protein